MDRRRKALSIFVIIAVVLVVGLWGIPVGNKQLAVSELTDEHIGKRVHVNGTVAVGTLRYMDNGSTILFTLTDGHRDVNVSYVEHHPPNLVEGNHAAVTGELLPNNTISANQIITKCPSKYSTEATALETKE
uniref:Cytochrome c-type biogenesis protein CcmE n=1 Tax=Candidatus Methanogaster sp. ANME-2c ERB4 TaxID=2759911 RepID=A0A7G9YG37_9EURY|nr:cytochrome c-type biogenesis protein CcmE [Methanosarcinales archaeon ANME-2c ERB4]